MQLSNPLLNKIIIIDNFVQAVLARAYRWQELLDSGEFDSPEALAEALNVNVSYVRRFLRLTLLAPPIVEAIFEGRAPWSLSLTKLDTNLPYSWKEQMKLFGMK